MIKCLFVWLLIGLSLPTYAQSSRSWKDFKDAFLDAFRAFPSQFETKSNIVAASIAAPALWYSFEHDDRISKLARSKEEKGAYNFVADISIAANFPILPFGFYAIGRSNEDEKMIRFSKELFTATYMAGWETVILSFIPINKRPNKNVTFWEKSFRGKSSFTSGHILPFTVLTMKALQFYGPLNAIIPGVLTFMTGYQRVQEGKHFLSDVVGAVFLGIFASEGTRYYSKHDNNHPIYKMIFEHDFRVSLLPLSQARGLSVSWNY